MKYFKNQYYSSDNRDFVSVKDQQPTPERMKMIKTNNGFIFSIISNIFYKEDFMNTKSMKKYLPTILAGNLARTDKVTGFNSKKLGEKIKFLVMYTSDKNHPENLEKFKNSFFMQSIMLPFYQGDFAGGIEGGSSDKWERYEKIGSDPMFKNMNALNASTKAYVNDDSVPVGLDMTTLIDAIVTTDQFGKYKIVEDFDDLATKEKMVEAMKEFINLLKSSKKFKENYKNPHLIEVESENE